MMKLFEMTNEELWKLFPVIITDHDVLWAEKYREEKKLLVDIIDESNIIQIDHIGSTAVPGLVAKPTIDILVQIKKDTNLNKIIRTLSEYEYIYVEQPDNPPPHMVFYKGYSSQGFQGQCFHVHIRYKGDWDELLFRDYLRENIDAADDYAKLKLSLAERYINNRDGYTEAKSDFIREIMKKARKSHFTE